MSKTVSESHRNLNTLLSSKGLEKETSNLDFKSNISKKQRHELKNEISGINADSFNDKKEFEALNSKYKSIKKNIAQELINLKQFSLFSKETLPKLSQIPDYVKLEKEKL